MTDDNTADTDELNRRHAEKMKRRKALQERALASKTVEKGLLMVHTGKGKGKSTAAFGLMMRAVGHGMRVGMVQFVKGAWSTGEFGSILADLMSPATAANFHGGTNTTLNGRDSRVYDFEVQQGHSHWKVVPTSQYYYPAFNGSIWFDRTTARAIITGERVEGIWLPPPIAIAHHLIKAWAVD